MSSHQAMPAIIRALHGVHRCLQGGIDVRGYCYWSVFDNFEWGLGYRPTFGLIAVDRVTQERRVKLSGKFLGEAARANGFEDSGYSKVDTLILNDE
jgi:beta-glucosidase